jgi:O-antigen ligase
MLRVLPNRAGMTRQGRAAWLTRLQHTPLNTPLGMLALFLGGLGSGTMLVALGTSTAVAITVTLGCVVAFVALVAFNQYEALASLVVVASLFLDWYQLVGKPLRIAVVSTLLASALLAVLFFRQSPTRPWVRLPLAGVWVVFLALCGWATIRGLDLQDSVTYYAGVVVNAVLICMIGLQLGRNERSLSRLFRMLSALGGLVALHTILYVQFGVFLLATPSIQAYLISRRGFTFTGDRADVRSGSFLINPDWNGAFMALMALLAVGLLVAARSWRGRLIYLAEAVLILIALLYTYSTAAWIAVIAGFVVFAALAVRGRTRLYLFGGTVLTLGAAYLLLSSRFHLLFEHATSADGLSDRMGLWETALRVIAAHPLTGIGIGLDTYFKRSVPYLPSSLAHPFGHPHEAFLEIAAMNGLPALFLFLLIVGQALRQALRACLRAAYQSRTRVLLSAGIAAVVTLSINSLAINGWTVTPLAAIAWLILGAISSSALAYSASHEDVEDSGESTEEVVAIGSVSH